jgi:uncharacterized protein (DUF433 family)
MNIESDWRGEIVSTPDVLRGKPRIKGTRIPVSLVLGYLAAGRTAEDIRREFPDLTPEQSAVLRGPLRLERHHRPPHLAGS